MKNLIYVLLLILTISENSFSQVSTRLVTITEGSPNNLSGLGYSFYGKILSDNNLYFTGSADGYREALWKTDGTIAGTSKVTEEENMFGGNWDQLLFVNEGVIKNDNGEWGILTPGSSNFTVLENMPTERLSQLQQINDLYYFYVNREDKLYLYKSNLGFTEVTEIGYVHDYHSFVLLTTGEFGAFVYNSNAFSENTPHIYLKDSDQLLTIEEYFESLDLSFSKLNDGYIIDKYFIALYLDENNSFQYKLIDMSTNVISDFPFIFEPISYHHYQNDLILVTQRDIVRINKEDLTYTIVFDDVFSFTTSELIDDKLYIQGRKESFLEGLVEIDLNDNSHRYLEGGETGNSFYSCEMVYYNDKFYYIAEDDYQLLMRYDFTLNEAIVVDTLSKSTGVTVEHALVEVQGNLVLSKRIGSKQHELYVLGDGVTNVSDQIQVQDLEIYPTVSEESITINSNIFTNMPNQEVSLFDINGRVVGTRQFSNGILDISDLSKSKYFGIIRTDGQLYRIQFIKI